MTDVVLTNRARTTVEDVAAVARLCRMVRAAPEILDQLERARATLDAAAATGQRIYGLNTGLGANLATDVAGEASTFQQQLLAGRAAAVGDLLPADAVRAAMFTRAAMLARGGSGISPGVFRLLVDALNAGIHPIMPALGSIGAGDLVLLAALGLALTGAGQVEYQGEVLPAAAAIERAGLTRAVLAPKDGLSLINASAVSVGLGAFAVTDCLTAFRQQQQAAALTLEALDANLTILDPRVQAARPAPGQTQAAAEIAALLKRAHTKPPATLQDPLSMRCLPAIHGALLDAIDRAKEIVEIELNGRADNPLVLAEDALVLSTGNFHTAGLALAFETLGLAIAQTAAASAARFIQLTGSSRQGLPKYLSPAGGAAAGFVPLQKVVSSILAMIRQRANPVLLDFLAVSEGVEDHASQTPLAVAKCREMTGLWQRLIAFELMAAAQVVYLRKGFSLAAGTARVHDAVRAIVAPLDEDRPLGGDAENLYAALSSGKWQA